MRLFSAQYVYTVSGPVLKRPVIKTGDDGTILSISDTGGNLSEQGNLEFYNGIIIPGFVNCHCHLELSYLKNEITPCTGLQGFLSELNNKRFNSDYDRQKAAATADSEMASSGVVLCADICNSSDTFALKTRSRIKYVNLIEVFGIDHNRAGERIKEALTVAEAASANGLKWNITPHSSYSLPVPLFRKLKDLCINNQVSSIHFLESEWEIPFLANHSGLLMETYKNFIPEGEMPLTVRDHITAILEEITSSGNIILVHNTFIEKKHIDSLRKRPGIFYCLCPDSNLFIENRLPPVKLLAEEGCNIVVGTDSLASNLKLDMLSELKTLQAHHPDIDLKTLVRWATLNGAIALGESSWAGSIEPGKRPGLVLLKDTDIAGQRLTALSSAVRLI